MSRSVQFIGIIGLIALVFALVTNTIVASDDFLLVPIHLVVAGVCLVLFVVRGGTQLLSTAAARRAAGFGAGVTAYSAVFVGLLGLVNYWVSKHDFLHYDSTEEQAYTLAPQTKQVLESFKEPVMARAFFVGKLDGDVEELLERLSKASNNFRWTWIDPERKPILMEKYSISSGKTIHFSFDGKEDGPETRIARDINEQEIVNALLKLTTKEAKVLYAISGHGEADLSSSSGNGFLFLKEGIEGENIAIKELALGEGGKVPADAAGILLLSPRRALLPSERNAIEDYLKNGGSALFATEPRTTDDVAELVRPLGITIGKDVIVDELMFAATGQGFGVQPMVTEYGSHPAVEDFSEGTIFTTASSVTRAKNVPAGADITELAFTSPNSWAESDLERIYGEQPTASRDPEDLKGRIPVAVAFEGTYPRGTFQREGAAASPPPAENAKKARVIVLGDIDFASNTNLRQLYNADFFLNLLNWTLDTQQKVTIRARNLRQSVKTLSEEQFNTVFVLTGLVLPELLLMSGFGVWWFRRR